MGKASRIGRTAILKVTGPAVAAVSQAPNSMLSIASRVIKRENLIKILLSKDNLSL
jgi:hypothetical protein